MRQAPRASLAEAAASFAQVADVTSDEASTSFQIFYRACGQASQVASQQGLEDALIKACVLRLAEVAVKRRFLWRRIYDCTQKLGSMPGWQEQLQSEIALNVLKGAGICGGWDQLNHVQSGDPMDSPGSYRMTHMSRVYAATTDKAPLCKELESVRVGDTVNIEEVVCNDIKELWGRLSSAPGWVLLLDMQSGFRAAVKEATANGLQNTPSESEMDGFIFVPAEEEGYHLEELQDFFNRLCELASISEESEEQQKEITRVQNTMNKEWLAHQRNSCLHYVFGGLVSSGKTTLLNSWLVNSLDGFPPTTELLPSDILENTSVVAILEIKPHHHAITMHVESVRYDEGAVQNANEPVCSEVRVFKSVPELADVLPDMLKSVPVSPGIVNRVVVQLPFAFVPFMVSAEQQRSAWIERQLPKTTGFLKQLLQPKTSELSTAPLAPGMAPIIVDTPGLDSLLVKHQLLCMLQEKSCVYNFLVDMTKPNPFGNQGFETVKFLMERLRLPFPPVIVFTKWEKFVRQWEDVRFRKREAKNQTPEQVAKRLIQMVFTKLRQADLKAMPYFAAVNAQSALMCLEDGDDENEKEEIEHAKFEMSQFMQSLHNLGSQVASPLRDHRVLMALMEKTQDIVNLVLRDADEARILSKQAEVELIDVAAGMKAKYHANVKRYFEGVTWTPRGVAAFQPPAPFNRDDCAVNLIPHTFEEIASEYKSGKYGIPESESLRAAILAIANVALKEIQHLILQNMHRFEQEVMSEFEEHLWSKIGNKVKLTCELEMTPMERFVGYGSIFAGFIGGTITYGGVISAAATSTAAGTGFLAGAGAVTAMSVATVVGAVPVVLGAAWLMSDQIGWWKWEKCEEKAFEEVLKSLENSQADIIGTLVKAFDDQVDDVMKKVREFRVPDSAREDTRTAANIIEKVTLEKRKAEDLVKTSLIGPASERWLSGSEELKKIWLSVAEEFSWGCADSSASSH